MNKEKPNKEKDTSPINAPLVISGLYVPSCTEKDGHAQPLATALPLDAGKHLCLQHFLKRCRTFQQRLPREQYKEVPAGLLDTITLRWSQLPSGDYEGQPEGGAASPLSAMTTLTYNLHPTA